MIEYLRLAFGTAVVLLPGAAVARAFGQRSASAVLAWGLACIFVAWAVVFTVHSNIRVAAVILAIIGITALVLGWDRGVQARLGAGWAWALGIVLGWFLWHVEGVVVGDGLFHEARVRKLVALGDLHLRTVDEFKDGGLHPGYAFPLWHGFLALVSWVSGVDPDSVLRHEPSLLAPVACAVAWEAGVVLFGSRWAGASVLLATLAVFCFGPGHGGSFTVLALPATAARQLLVPAAIVLFFATPGRRNWAALAAAFGALVLTHPTYAIFLLIPLAGYAAVRAVEWRAWSPAFVAAVVPTALALLWLKPIVDETVSHDPAPGERLRAIQHYGSSIVVESDHHYRLAAEMFGRSGVVAVAALLLLPLAGLAIRRRWAAFVLGGTLLVLVVMEVPWLFVHFSDAVSLSQSRRAAGFAPLPFALAGALALAVRRVAVLPLALVAGIVLQRLWPGDFEYGLRHGGPALATWFALAGGVVALAGGLVLRRRDLREHHALGAAAMLLLVLPVFVHGIWHWSVNDKVDPYALSPRLVHNLRTKVPKGAVVLAPVDTSYRVAAKAPVYIVAAPVTHVANTTANRPYDRVRAVHHWVLTSDPRVAKRYGATWAIRKGHLYRLPR
ncbi:MAG: hypothetical protein WAU41_13360 [Gaiellaceae bacterium]